MERFGFILALLVAWAPSASAQVCTARVIAPGSQWEPVPSLAAGGSLRTMAHLRCMACQPEVSVLLTAGPASPALQHMPIGLKVGREWARAVVDNPTSREGFRQSVLRSELRSSPGCRLQGSVIGVAEIGNLGTIGTEIQAECAGGAERLAGEIYSAYDYNCEYQVQVVWPASSGSLPQAIRAEVQALLQKVAFGPR